MPRLEEAKKVHRELEDTREILKTLRNQTSELFQGDGSQINVVNTMDQVDSLIRQVQGEIAKVVGQEVMK